jgi:hypothetical protein
VEKETREDYRRIYASYKVRDYHTENNARKHKIKLGHRSAKLKFVNKDGVNVPIYISYRIFHGISRQYLNVHQ